MAKRKKDKRTNNDLQDIKQKTTDRATRNPLKTEGELRCSGSINRRNSCFTQGTHRVILVANPVIIMFISLRESPNLDIPFGPFSFLAR